MTDRYLVQVEYNCGSAVKSWFVTWWQDGSGIGATHCPLYGTERQDCEDDCECGGLKVLQVKPYSASEAKRRHAIDLTREEAGKREDRGLAKIVVAAA